MLKNLPLVSLSMLDILGIYVVIVISLILRINFAKSHMGSEVVLSMTLLFDRMLSFVMNHITLLPYRWEIDAFGYDGW